MEHSSIGNMPESEMELAFKTLSQSACGALVATTEGEIVYANDRLCEITGYSAEELIGKNPKILQSGNTPRETYLLLWNTISGGRSWHGVLQNRKKSGELYWESITITPITTAEGEITHFSAILEDVTSQKETETRQAELDEEIFQEEKRESMTAMAGGIAHVLNNSLTCIIAACDLAKKSKSAEQLGQMLEHIEAAAKQSAEFLRMASNLWKPTPAAATVVDLPGVLRQQLPLYRETERPRSHLGLRSHERA